MSGTNFKQYCQDNIKITQQGTENLEYPVNYWDGSIAVSQIDRTIYYPEGNYGINLPTPDSFSGMPGIKDPVINQTGQSGLGCNASSNGCIMSQLTPISFASEVFETPSQTGKKEICVRAILPKGQALMVDIYLNDKEKSAISLFLNRTVALWDLSTMYCSSKTQPLNEFRRFVLSTSANDKNAAKINNIFIRPLQ